MIGIHDLRRGWGKYGAEGLGSVRRRFVLMWVACIVVCRAQRSNRRGNRDTNLSPCLNSREESVLYSAEQCATRVTWAGTLHRYCEGVGVNLA